MPGVTVRYYASPTHGITTPNLANALRFRTKQNQTIPILDVNELYLRQQYPYYNSTTHC